MISVQPGDILAVRSSGFAGAMIRFGAALLDRPNYCVSASRSRALRRASALARHFRQ